MGVIVTDLPDLANYSYSEKDFIKVFKKNFVSILEGIKKDISSIVCVDSNKLHKLVPADFDEFIAEFKDQFRVTIREVTLNKAKRESLSFKFDIFDHNDFKLSKGTIEFFEFSHINAYKKALKL